MSTKLMPSDRCYRIVNGLKLRGVVVDYLLMTTRGNSGNHALVPFQRRKNVVFVERGELRKLPGEAKVRPSKRQKLIAKLEAPVRAGEITLREAVNALNPPCCQTPSSSASASAESASQPA